MNHSMRLIICSVILISGALVAQAQTSTFTYQGRLTDSSMPASGAYIMEFRLFSNLTGGAATDTQSAVPVTVTNGVFTVELNFTATPFLDGEPQYLEIAVKRTAGETYTTLAPRQPITSAPYAIRARRAGAADNLSSNCVECVTSAQIAGVDGGKINGTVANADTLDDIDSSGFVQTDSNAFIRNQTSAQSAHFNITGSGTTGGTLSGNTVNTATVYNINGNRVLSAPGENNLFAGVTTGRDNSSGTGNSFVGAFAGTKNTSGGSNSFVGVNAGSGNKTGSNNSFFGVSTGIFSDAGNDNSFFGSNAGAFTGTGSNNSFVGSAAGFATTAGAHNSFVGAGAGRFNSTGTGNSFVGSEAGTTNTTGGNNTVIGRLANVGSESLTYATAIGAGAVVRKSNTIALGREGGQDLVQIFRLGLAGGTQLCLNGINEFSNCSSSLRYKTNIAPFTFGLSFIKQLRPIAYDWKTGGAPDVGFGAEDVARINPRFVTYNAAGEVEGVKYDRLSTVFVNAINEQQKQIERQNAQIEQQQKQLDEFKQIVCALKPEAGVCK